MFVSTQKRWILFEKSTFLIQIRFLNRKYLSTDFEVDRSASGNYSLPSKDPFDTVFGDIITRWPPHFDPKRK
jgi:hypothetical protein